MKRVDVQKVYVWNKNRSTTFLLLLIAILLIVYSLNMVIKLFYLDYQTTKVKNELEALIAENDKIQGDINLNGGMVVTVMDNYMTDGENVYSFEK